MADAEATALAAAPHDFAPGAGEQQVQDAPQVLVAAAELEQSMSQLETDRPSAAGRPSAAWAAARPGGGGRQHTRY